MDDHFYLQAKRAARHRCSILREDFLLHLSFRAILDVSVHLRIVSAYKQEYVLGNHLDSRPESPLTVN